MWIDIEEIWFGLLMGKFRKFVTELSVLDIIVYVRVFGGGAGGGGGGGSGDGGGTRHIFWKKKKK